MKNVLYVHRTQGSAVEAVHINGIADNLETLGYKVNFLSPLGDKKPGQVENKKSPVKKKSFLNWFSSQMPEFLFEIVEIFYNVIGIFKGSKRNKENKITFIYERYAIFSIVGVVLAKKYNCPILLEVNYTSLSPLVRKRTRLFKPLARLVDQWVFNNVTAIVAVSGRLKNQLIDDYNISPEKVEVIANAANPEHFKPVKINNSTCCTIGFVGGFYPWHGLDLLVDAIIILKSKNQNIQCLLIGDGPELPKIKSRIEKLSLTEYFTFPGRISHKKLAEYVDKFDIGIMPDSNDYGSPMKLFEYMAAGIPYVAADYPPISEITTNQGKLFEIKNVNSFAEALLAYTEDAKARQLAGGNGRELVENHFNWKQNTYRSIEHLAKCNVITTRNH